MRVGVSLSTVKRLTARADLPMAGRCGGSPLRWPRGPKPSAVRHRVSGGSGGASGDSGSGGSCGRYTGIEPHRGVRRYGLADAVVALEGDHCAQPGR